MSATQAVQTSAKLMAQLILDELAQGWRGVLLLSLIAGVAAIGSFLGKYLEVKGQNLATKEDYDALKGQLAENTLVVERIKTDLAHTDWAKKEWASLRIKKIEELMTLIEDYEDFLTKMESESLSGTYEHTPEARKSPLNRISVTAELYLPELQETVASYAKAVRAIESGYLIAWALCRNAPTQNRARIWEERVEALPYDDHQLLRKELTRLAAETLQLAVAAGAARPSSN